MVRIFALFLIFYLGHPAFGQQEDEKILFSDALTIHLPKYKKQSEKAHRLRDFDKGQRLYDSLIEYKLKQTYMDDFCFKKLNGKEITLSEYKKPVYLITYASWIVPTKGEIPALNRLAKKYSDEIDFVILFWDDQKTAQKAARSYNENIQVLYVDEQTNKKSFVISQLKHSLGFPTTFLLSPDKQILDIRRVVAHPYHKAMEASFKLNYSLIHEGIANHLLPEKDYDPENEPMALN